MNFDPKNKVDDESTGGQQQFDPQEIIQSSPNKIQQNSIEDFDNDGAGQTPDVIRKSNENDIGNSNDSYS